MAGVGEFGARACTTMWCERHSSRRSVVDLAGKGGNAVEGHEASSSTHELDEACGARLGRDP